MKNIVLIGMPGSGKTTVGTHLASRLHWGLVDTDALVEQAAGATIPALFAAQGEAHFRALEREAIVQAAGLKNAIIATGGGAVLRRENMEVLDKTGIVFFLDRPPEALARESHAGRPLIGAHREVVFSLYTARIDLYRKYAQYTISSANAPEEAAEKIVQILTETGVFHEVSRD